MQIQRCLETSERVLEELNWLHDTLELSWEKIALLPFYKGIPWSTLATVVSTRRLPLKWGRRLRSRYMTNDELEPDELLAAFNNRWTMEE